MKTHVIALRLDNYAELLFELKKEIVLLINEQISEGDQLVAFHREPYNDEISEDCLILKSTNVRELTTKSAGKRMFYMNLTVLRKSNAKELRRVQEFRNEDEKRE